MVAASSNLGNPWKNPWGTALRTRPLSLGPKAFGGIFGAAWKVPGGPWFFLENLRIFQHTPGTYPRPPTNSLWRNSFHLRVWGSLGYAPGDVGVPLERKKNKKHNLPYGSNHRTSEDEPGVSNHRNETHRSVRFHETILSFDDWIPRVSRDGFLYFSILGCPWKW